MTGSFAEEYRYLKPDGTVVWVQDEMHLVRDERGEPLYVQGFVQDITERKLTEAERDRLRDELLQAQRLEALGRLAGGVAHDFNNMLTAIRGYAELLVGDPNASGSTRENALRIMQAAEQAADLPRQLLAFGRKQVLEPAIVEPERRRLVDPRPARARDPERSPSASRRTRRTRGRSQTGASSSTRSSTSH